MSLASSADHSLRNQSKDFLLIIGQAFRSFNLNSQKNCVVIGHFGVVDNTLDIRITFILRRQAETALCHLYECPHRICHIFRNKLAVGSRIGDELLLVESLKHVECGLCRHAEVSVALALECRQIIERRRIRGFLFLLHTGNDCLSAITGCTNGFRFLGGKDFFFHDMQIAASQFDIVVLLLFEVVYLLLPLNEHCQRGCLYSSDCQPLIVQLGKKPRGIDTDEPICL